MSSLIQNHAHLKGQRSNHHIFKFSQIHCGPKNGQTVTRPLQQRVGSLALVLTYTFFLPDLQST